jgi:hypothetical protein
MGQFTLKIHESLHSFDIAKILTFTILKWLTQQFIDIVSPEENTNQGMGQMQPSCYVLRYLIKNTNMNQLSGKKYIL